MSQKKSENDSIDLALSKDKSQEKIKNKANASKHNNLSEPKDKLMTKVAKTPKPTAPAKPANKEDKKDNIRHPDLISPLSSERIHVSSGFTRDSRRVKGDDHDYEYDVIVLGAGPSGEAASMKLAKCGKKVAVIDPRKQVGGNSTHVGTIPSKALRQSVFNIINYRRDPLFSANSYEQVPLNKVLSSARQIIREQVRTHTRFYERNQIDVIQGWANFVDKHTIRVEFVDGSGEEFITFNKAIVTVGSRPYRPAGLDFTHPRVFDSDKILQMDYVAQKIIIYGAGVIGCEYASIFTGLGYKVDLINNKGQLLSYLDNEIGDALSHDFREFGVLIRNNEEMERLETHDDYVILHLKSGKKIKSDAMLWCNGRSGNTDSLNLEAVGLKANNRGQLKVDDTYCTEVENIYAAGDVIGWPSLASAAYDQGRCAAAHMVGEEDAKPVSSVPTGIYTIPEISSIGKTEEELTEERVPYEVGQAFFKHLARAQIIGQRTGMLKILFHRETLDILGIHCYGNNASEIIHIGQAVMESDNTLEYFLNTTFNYPTMAEAYRVAALNGLNRVF